MNDDEVIIVSEPQEAVVLVVDDSESQVLVVEEEGNQVLVVHEGPPGPKGDKGDTGDVPQWVLNTKITVGNSAPPSPNVGDLWVDTN